MPLPPFWMTRPDNSNSCDKLKATYYYIEEIAQRGVSACMLSLEFLVEECFLNDVPVASSTTKLVPSKHNFWCVTDRTVRLFT